MVIIWEKRRVETKIITKTTTVPAAMTTSKLKQIELDYLQQQQPFDQQE